MAIVETTYASEAEYRADHSRVSQSMLKVFTESRFVYNCLYVARTHEPPPPTAAMILGTLLHSCVFEPGYFESLCVAPRCDRRTKEGKAIYAEFVEQSVGKRIMDDADDYAEVAGMYRRLRGHRLATTLLWGDGAAETVFIGECEATGIPLKGRLDKLAESQELIVDLKKCGYSPTKDAFAAQATRLGYWQQAHFYTELVRQQTGKTLEFVFVCVSSKPPHPIGIFPVGQRGIELGRAKVDKALKELRACLDSGDWSDEAEAGVTIDPPAWAERAMESANY